MTINKPIPVIGFAAFSGTGKTTLLTAVLPLLKQRGVRVAMIKHAHHRFDVDVPGKDSYELRKAGADQMLIASGQRWALMTEINQPEKDPDLSYLLSRLDLEQTDLVLVEGFKHVDIPKIELHRPSTKQPLIFPSDRYIVAVATDAPDAIDTKLPLLDINNPNQVTEFICNYFYIT